jgi:hypothetical protein
MDCNWSTDEDGNEVDVCVECKIREDFIMAEIERNGREKTLEGLKNGELHPPPDGFDAFLAELTE